MTKPHISQDPVDPLLTTREAALLQTQLDDAHRQIAERDELIATLRARLFVPDIGAEQNWSAVDGAVAWHLIDRSGDGWGHIGAMMNAWRDAHPELARLRTEIERLLADVERQNLQLPPICRDVEKLDMTLDSDDWAGDELMTDITNRALARLDAIGVRSEGGAA